MSQPMPHVETLEEYESRAADADAHQLLSSLHDLQYAIAEGNARVNIILSELTDRYTGIIQDRFEKKGDDVGTITFEISDSYSMKIARRKVVSWNQKTMRQALEVNVGDNLVQALRALNDAGVAVSFKLNETQYAALAKTRPVLHDELTKARTTHIVQDKIKPIPKEKRGKK